MQTSYARRRPEDTVLVRTIEEHLETFAARAEPIGTPMPAFIRRELEALVACGRLELGFLRCACARCSFEHLIAFS